MWKNLNKFVINFLVREIIRLKIIDIWYKNYFDILRMYLEV